jgi:hypothetical protein
MVFPASFFLALDSFFSFLSGYGSGFGYGYGYGRYNNVFSYNKHFSKDGALLQSGG